MEVIHTVLGDIDPGDLGATLCHEHLLLDISPQQTLRAEDVLAELQAYKRLGGGAIIELTNIAMGRDVIGLRELSRATGLHIIAPTGYYKQSHYPATIAQKSIEELAEQFAGEVENGIDGTGIHAGVIGEIGTSQEEITPDEEKVLRASARAARLTGAGLSTHTSFGFLALEQVEMIKEEGCPLSRVSIGHLDLIPDANYHTKVAEQGAYVQYDTFGKEMYQRDEARLACLVEMIRRGFRQQILLSCDITRVSYLTSSGGWGYTHLFNTIIPALKQAGITEDVIYQLLVENPRRFLTRSIRPGD